MRSCERSFDYVLFSAEKNMAYFFVQVFQALTFSETCDLYDGKRYLKALHSTQKGLKWVTFSVLCQVPTHHFWKGQDCKVTSASKWA